MKITRSNDIVAGKGKSQASTHNRDTELAL